MDLEMHLDKIKKLEQELAELTTSEKDDKEVTVGTWCQFDLFIAILYNNDGNNNN